MVFPLMLAAAGIGAAGNLVGGLLGSRAQQQANDQNYQIALMNYYAQEQARRDAQAEASRQDTESKLGTTDAQGNRTYFKPGVGWVTELAPGQKNLQQEYSAEEEAQLQDLKTKRDVMYRNLGRQGAEGNVAGGIREAMLRNYRGDPQAGVARKNRLSVEAANAGMDTAMSQAMIDAVRTGTKGQADIASKFGRDKYSALRTAFMENENGADNSGDAYIGEQGNLANLYNMFATRASAMPDVSYNPRNIEGQTASALSTAMTGGANASSRLQAAKSQKPADFNFQAEPNFGIANTIQQAGAGLSAGLNYYDSARGMGNNAYGNYATTGYYPPSPASSNKQNPSIYKTSTGLW